MASYPWRVPWAGMPARRLRRLVLSFRLTNFNIFSSVKDLELIARVTFGNNQGASYSVVPIPFRDVQLPQKLRFGYYTSGYRLMSTHIWYPLIIAQTTISRPPLPVNVPFWRRLRPFVGQDMNVLSLKYRQVIILHPHLSMIITYTGTLVEVALKVFVGLTSADGYKTMLSHLGPDPKVWQLLLLLMLKSNFIFTGKVFVFDNAWP